MGLSHCGDYLMLCFNRLYYASIASEIAPGLWPGDVVIYFM